MEPIRVVEELDANRELLIPGRESEISRSRLSCTGRLPRSPKCAVLVLQMVNFSHYSRLVLGLAVRDTELIEKKS